MTAQPLTCGWARHSELEHLYHDNEWGRLKTDDRTLFEFMVLESAQAGLSWRTVLNKRAAYQKHYRDFEPAIVAGFGSAEIDAMLADPGVIRNRAKIESSIRNAQIFLEISKECDGFSNYLWHFTAGKVQTNNWSSLEEIPAETPVSQQIAKDLKARGIRFFGSTIIYAYLQACGYINDHLISCPCHQECLQLAKRLGRD